jgi:predicted alpha/beta hydrolase
MSLGMSDVHPRTTIEHRPYVLFEYSLAALDLRVVLLGTPLYSPGESVGAFFKCTFSVREKQSNAAVMSGSGASSRDERACLRSRSAFSVFDE